MFSFQTWPRQVKVDNKVKSVYEINWDIKNAFRYFSCVESVKHRRCCYVLSILSSFRSRYSWKVATIKKKIFFRVSSANNNSDEQKNAFSWLRYIFHIKSWEEQQNVSNIFLFYSTFYAVVSSLMLKMWNVLSLSSLFIPSPLLLRLIVCSFSYYFTFFDGKIVEQHVKVSINSTRRNVFILTAKCTRIIFSLRTRWSSTLVVGCAVVVKFTTFVYFF